MAEPENSKSTRGKFKPGQSGNPGGRPKLPIEIKLARQKKCAEFWKVFCKLADTNNESFAKVTKSPTATQWEQCAGSMLSLFRVGEKAAVSFVSDQLFGKPMERADYFEGPIEGLEPEQLNKLLARHIAGEIQLSREQQQSIRMILQQKGALPDPDNSFRFVTEDQLKPEAKDVPGQKH